MDLPRLLASFGVLAVMGVLVLALRWTWGTGRDLRLPEPDDATGQGLLEEVGRAPTAAAAQVLRARLLAAGIRATVGRDGEAYRLLVFVEDAGQAKLVLRADP